MNISKPFTKPILSLFVVILLLKMACWYSASVAEGCFLIYSFPQKNWKHLQGLVLVFYFIKFFMALNEVWSNQICFIQHFCLGVFDFFSVLYLIHFLSLTWSKLFFHSQFLAELKRRKLTTNSQMKNVPTKLPAYPPPPLKQIIIRPIYNR